MALTINVSKISVSEQMENLWNITLNLKCENNSVEVINQNFSVRYRLGQDIEEKVKEVQNKMQEVIDDHKDEQQIFNHQKLDNAVNYLNTNLSG